MPVVDVLTPQEASYIATNCYFTLKDWIKNSPEAGTETVENVHNRVLGPGTAGTPKPGAKNTSLKDTSLAGAKLQKVVGGTSGFGTCSGFGYLLKVKKGDQRHAIIATRGTRPEMGAPDLLTDARAGMTGFGDYGPVHKGFKRTFDSVMANLAHENVVVMDADVVHCVGHSLGGAWQRYSRPILLGWVNTSNYTPSEVRVSARSRATRQCISPSDSRTFIGSPMTWTPCHSSRHTHIFT